MGFANLLACCGAGSNVEPDDGYLGSKQQEQKINVGAMGHRGGPTPLLIPPDGALPIVVPIAAAGRRPSSWASNAPAMDVLLTGYMHAVGANGFAAWGVSNMVQKSTKPRVPGAHAAYSQLPYTLPADVPRIVLRVLGAQQLAVLSARALEALLPTLVCMPQPSSLAGTSSNGYGGHGGVPSSSDTAASVMDMGGPQDAGLLARVAGATSLRAAVQAAIEGYWDAVEQEQRRQEQQLKQVVGGGRSGAGDTGRNKHTDSLLTTRDSTWPWLTPAMSGPLFVQAAVVNPAAQSMLGVSSLQEAALQLAGWLAEGKAGSSTGGLAVAVVRTAAVCMATLPSYSATGAARVAGGSVYGGSAKLPSTSSASAGGPAASSPPRSASVVHGELDIAVAAAFIADTGAHGVGGVGPALVLELSPASGAGGAGPRGMPPAGATPDRVSPATDLAAPGELAVALRGGPALSLQRGADGTGVQHMDTARVLVWSGPGAAGPEAAAGMLNGSSRNILPFGFNDSAQLTSTTYLQLLSLAGMDGGNCASGRPSNPNLVSLAGNVPPSALPRMVRGVAMLDEVPVIATLMEFDGSVIYQNEHSRRYWGACSGPGAVEAGSASPFPGSTITAVPGTSPSRALMGALFRTRRDLLAELLADVEVGFAWRRVLPVPPSFARPSLSVSMVQRHNSSMAVEASAGQVGLERVAEGRETSSSMSATDRPGSGQRAPGVAAVSSGQRWHGNAAANDAAAAASAPPLPASITALRVNTGLALRMEAASQGDSVQRADLLPPLAPSASPGQMGAIRGNVLTPLTKRAGITDASIASSVRWAEGAAEAATASPRPTAAAAAGLVAREASTTDSALGVQASGRSKGSGRVGPVRSVSFSASVKQARVAAAAGQDGVQQLGTALTADEPGARQTGAGDPWVSDGSKPEHSRAASGVAISEVPGDVPLAGKTSATSTNSGNGDGQVGRLGAHGVSASGAVRADGRPSGTLIAFHSLDSQGPHLSGPPLATLASMRASMDEALLLEMARASGEAEAVGGAAAGPTPFGAASGSWRNRLHNGVGASGALGAGSSQSGSPMARDPSMARNSRMISTGGMAVEPSSRVMSLIGRPSAKPGDNITSLDGLPSGRSFSAAHGLTVLSADGGTGAGVGSLLVNSSKSFTRASLPLTTAAMINDAAGSTQPRAPVPLPPLPHNLQGANSPANTGSPGGTSSQQPAIRTSITGLAASSPVARTSGDGLHGLPTRVAKLTSGSGAGRMSGSGIQLGQSTLGYVRQNSRDAGLLGNGGGSGGSSHLQPHIPIATASAAAAAAVEPSATGAIARGVDAGGAVAAAAAVASPPVGYRDSGGQQDIAMLADLDEIQEGDFEGDFRDDESEAAPVVPRTAGSGSTASVCWHEVQVVPILDPVTGQQVMLLLQSDITGRAELEARMAALTESQLTMLEQMFPRHVLEFMVAQPDPSVAQPAMSSLASSHEQVTILFTDIVGFTTMSKEVPPDAVMSFLNELFTLFDELVDAHQIYKVETAGDCYIAAGGLMGVDEDGFTRVDPSPDATEGAARVLAFAKSLLRCAATVRMPHNGQPTQVRVGMHTGPVVTGLIGTKLPKYSIFGDTMNTASRMESTAKYGCIQVSQITHELLQAAGATARTTFKATGGVEVKGKGVMSTFIWDPEEHPSEANEQEEEATWDMLILMKQRSASRPGAIGDDNRGRRLDRNETDASHTTVATVATVATQAMGASRPASASTSRGGLFHAVSGLAAAAGTSGAAAGPNGGPGLALTAALLETLYAQDAGMTAVPMGSRRASSYNGSMRSVRLPGAIPSHPGSVTSRRSGGSGVSNALSAISTVSKAAGRQHPLLGMLMGRSRPQSAVTGPRASVTASAGGAGGVGGSSAALGGVYNVAAMAAAAATTLMVSDQLGIAGGGGPSRAVSSISQLPQGGNDRGSRAPAGVGLVSRHQLTANNTATRTAAADGTAATAAAGAPDTRGGEAGRGGTSANGPGTAAVAAAASARRRQRIIKRSVTFSALMKNVSSKSTQSDGTTGTSGTNTSGGAGAVFGDSPSLDRASAAAAAAAAVAATAAAAAAGQPATTPAQQSPAIAAAVAAMHAQRMLTKQLSAQGRSSAHSGTHTHGEREKRESHQEGTGLTGGAHGVGAGGPTGLVGPTGHGAVAGSDVKARVSSSGAAGPCVMQMMHLLKEQHAKGSALHAHELAAAAAVAAHGHQAAGAVHVADAAVKP